MDHCQQYILSDSKVQNDNVKDINLQYICVPKSKMCNYNVRSKIAKMYKFVQMRRAKLHKYTQISTIREAVA